MELIRQTDVDERSHQPESRCIMCGNILPFGRLDANSSAMTLSPLPRLAAAVVDGLRVFTKTF